MRWLLAAMLAGLGALGGGAFAQAPARPNDSLYLRPGLIVAAAGTRLNLYCLGSGSPTVVFDAGHQDWAPAWSTIQPEVARWTRACSYDRPGSGYSDPGPRPRSSARIADELHAALHAAGIAGPYILVGHAFGGYNVRAFAYRYLDEVAGMVLLDTDTGDVEPADIQRAHHDYFIVQARELRACGDAVAQGRPLASVPPPANAPTYACEQRFFRGLPDPIWSAALNARLLDMVRRRVSVYDEVVAELEAMPGDEVDLQQHRRSLGARPLRILTAGRLASDDDRTPPEAHLRHLEFDDQVAHNQARLLDLSTDARQIFALHTTGGYIQFDQPDLVVATIRDVFDRAGGRVRPQ